MREPRFFSRLEEKCFDGNLQGSSHCIGSSSSHRFFAVNLVDKIVIFEDGINLSISSMDMVKFTSLQENCRFKQTIIVPPMFAQRSVGTFDPAFMSTDFEFRIHRPERGAKFMKFNFSPTTSDYDSELLAVSGDDGELRIYYQGADKKWNVLLNLTDILYDSVNKDWFTTNMRQYEDFMGRRSQFEVTEFCWDSRPTIPAHGNGEHLHSITFATRDGRIHFADFTYTVHPNRHQLVGVDYRFSLETGNRSGIDTLVYCNAHLVVQFYDGILSVMKPAEGDASRIDLWKTADNLPSAGVFTSISTTTSTPTINVFFLKPQKICQSTISINSRVKAPKLVEYSLPSSQHRIKALFQLGEELYVSQHRSTQLHKLLFDEDAQTVKFISHEFENDVPFESVSIDGIAQSSNGSLGVAFARTGFSRFTDKPLNVRILFVTEANIPGIFSNILRNIVEHKVDRILDQLFLFRVAVLKASSQGEIFENMKIFCREFDSSVKTIDWNVLKENMAPKKVHLFLRSLRNITLRLKEYINIFNVNDQIDVRSITELFQFLNNKILKAVLDDYIASGGLKHRNGAIYLSEDKVTLEQIVSLHNIDALDDTPLVHQPAIVRKEISKLLNTKIKTVIERYPSNILTASNLTGEDSRLSLKEFFNRCPLCEAQVDKVEIVCSCSSEEDAHTIEPCYNSLILSNLDLDFQQCGYCSFSYFLQSSIWPDLVAVNKCIFCI